MSSRNVETVKSTHENWNRRDFDAMVNFMNENAPYIDQARNVTLKNRNEFKDWAKAWAKAFSDGRITNARYTDAGDTVISEFTAEGTNDGPFGTFPATRRHASVPFCEIAQFDANGRIVSGSVYYDQLSFLTQLGHTQSRSAKA